MTNFLKLSSMIININRINAIKIYPHVCVIELPSTRISGGLFLASGSISGYNNLIEIYKEHNEIDYNIVTKWINTLPNNN